MLFNKPMSDSDDDDRYTYYNTENHYRNVFNGCFWYKYEDGEWYEWMNGVWIKCDEPDGDEINDTFCLHHNRVACPCFVGDPVEDTQYGEAMRVVESLREDLTYSPCDEVPPVVEYNGNDDDYDDDESNKNC